MTGWIVLALVLPGLALLVGLMFWLLTRGRQADDTDDGPPAV